MLRLSQGPCPLHDMQETRPLAELALRESLALKIQEGFGITRWGEAWSGQHAKDRKARWWCMDSIIVITVVIIIISIIFY